MKIKNRFILTFGVSTLFLFLLLGLFLFLSVRTKIHKELEKELNNKIEMVKDYIESNLKTGIKNYLRGIAEKSKTDTEMFYQAFFNKEIKDEKEAQDKAWEFLKKITIGKTGYIYILNSQGILLKHPKESIVGKDMSKVPNVIEQLKMKSEKSAGYIEYMWKNPGEEKERAKALYQEYFEKWDWIISVSSYKDEFSNLVDLENLRADVSKIRIGDTGYPFVFDGNFDFIIHPKLQGKNGKDFQDSNGKFFMKEIGEKKNGNLHYDWKNPGEEKAKEKFSYFRYIPELDWYVVISSYLYEFYSTIYIVKDVLIIASIIFILMFAALIFWSVGSLLKPIHSMKNTLSDIAQGQGDLTYRIEIKNANEIGEMAGFYNSFADKIKTLIKNIKNESENIAQTANDLASNSHESASSIQEITASTSSVLSNILRQKDKVMTSSKEIESILTGIGEINRMGDQIENQIASASASIEEMAANIVSSANMAHQADNISKNLENKSEEGKQSVEKLSIAIEEVARNSENIQEMVKLIMDISEQTNLLAMNAAIEAAHAGDYGKGFAVVAEEIRKLADKSSKSAKEIQEVVRKISESISYNLDISSKTRENFTILKKEIDQVRNSNHEISSSMEEQKTANQSILESISALNTYIHTIVDKLKEQVKKGETIGGSLNELKIISEEISTAMEEEKNALQDTAASAEHISNISNALKTASDKIKKDFNQFKID
ncbi:MAG: hypothetical protein A2Y41_00270 [Spirochaetes bacterium GWB1_36_13]|nr:MAG: hypothetical protein A2Y41_00270 [Spirochaetes bacterium GWB1_36_13]